MRKYEPPSMPSRGWFEGWTGPSQATKDFENSLKEESINRHLEMVRSDMVELCQKLKKEKGSIYKMKTTFMKDLFKIARDEQRDTPRLEYITMAEDELMKFISSTSEECELMYTIIQDYKKLVPTMNASTEKTLDSFESCAKEVHEKIWNITAELNDLKEKSISENKKAESEEKKKVSKSSKFFGDFEQKYVKETKPKPKPKTNSKPKKTINKKSNPSVKLIPNKYFRDMVMKYTGKTMTSPVADKKEIKQMWKKVSLHVGANSTKYQKLSSSEQKEADEIFKKITNEKDLYVPKGSGKRKTKKRKSKKRKTKKTRRSSK